MSLVLSVVYENSAQILTDGAALDQDGNLQAIYTKVGVSQKPPFAIAGRGDTIVLNVMQTGALAMAEFCTFDEILENIEAGLQHASETILAKGAHVELIVAGLSETCGFSHYAICSSQYLDWLPAFQMRQIPDQAFVFGGAPDVEAMIAEGAEPDMMIEAGESALSLFGGAMANAFRKMSGKHPSTGILLDIRKGMSCIGGRADVAIVTREGVSVERVATWPDEFGKPIDPTVPLAA